ncbi:arsenate reductase/protein-tyrosine-phosphatase family protein [Brachybacterium sp. DNPG3]
MESYRVLTVCTGNVCRSPAAAVMLREGVRLDGLEDRVEVGSAGTSWEAEGQPMDDRTVLSLERAGYRPPFIHTASTIHLTELLTWDLVLPMTAEHAASLRRMVDHAPPGSPVPEVVLWRQFDPTAPVTATEAELGVKDPWYSGQKCFDRTVLSMQAAIPSLLLHLRSRLRERDEAADRATRRD